VITTNADVTRPVNDEADYVIVGTGAAGATVARVLTEAGADVVMVEEGAPFPPKERTPALYRTMKAAWREMGTTTTVGRAMIPILQGRCVGGTTVINGAICWRLPEDVHDQWSADRGIAERIPYDALMRHAAQIEDELGISGTPTEAWGGNERIMDRACRKLGIEGASIARNVREPCTAARCLQGCPDGRKLSMDLCYIPRAIERGARVYATCRVESIHTQGGRAVGVGGTFKRAAWDAPRHSLTVRARKGVVLAASAVQTPELLLRNRLANSSRQVGRHFQCHPGAGVVGLYDEDVNMWHGATQGYESIEWRPQGFKIETLSLPPELAAVRIPGVGRALMERMSTMRRMALMGVQIRARAHGRIRTRGKRGTTIFFDLGERDVQVLKRGLKTICELHFAAGAKELLVGVHGLPERVTSPDELGRFDGAPLTPRAFSLIATHLFGTCRMGTDPRTSVVRPDFRTHDVDGLYIVDSSVFPTNLGVNPQHSIMSMAWHAAEGMAGG